MQFSVVKQFRNSLLRYAPTYATKLSVTELYAHMPLKLFSFKMDFNELVVNSRSSTFDRLDEPFRPNAILFEFCEKKVTILLSNNDYIIV